MLIKNNIKITTIHAYWNNEAIIYIYPTLDKFGNRLGFAKRIAINGEERDGRNITRKDFDLLVKTMTQDFNETLSRMEAAFNRDSFELNGEIVCPAIPEEERWQKNL